MASEYELARIFIEYLRKRGYPEDSIGAEYKIGNNYYVDIAIFDRKQNVPIQLFELKANKNESSKRYGISQLEKSRKILKDKNIPAYLVFPKSEEPYFEVLDIDNEKNDDSKNINNESFLIFNYQAQRTKTLFKNAENVKQEKKSTIDKFEKISFGLGFLILVLGVLSKVGLFKIDPEDLIMLSFLICLFLIPYVNKIKILGIEFERLTENKEEK